MSIKDGYLLIDNHYVPKFLITRDDYTELFAYVKYLEHKGEEKKAYKIYIDALKGLNNTESKSMISMIFRMVNEKIILTSLRESLKHNRFSETIKKKLKKELKELLLLDKHLLLETIEYEYMIVNKISENSLLKDISTQEEKRLMTKVLFYSKKYINTYHQKLKQAIIENSLTELESSHKKDIEKFKSLKNKINLVWNYFKIKVAVLFSIEHDYTELAKGMAKVNVLVATPAMNRTYNDYLEQIENNQSFLENL